MSDRTPPAITLAEVQDLMERLFGDLDRARGMPASVAWLCEEVGELAQAVRKGTPEQQLHELGDVIAWTASIANQLGLDLTEAMARYVAQAEARPGADPTALGASEAGRPG